MLVEQIDPTQLSTTMLLPLAEEPTQLTLGDLNGDGIADAAVVTKSAARRRVLGLQILLGTASGQYAPVRPTRA